MAMAMRTPVKEPGPRPTATHAMLSRATPAFASSSSTQARSRVFDARRASTSTEATHEIRFAALSIRPMPMAMTSLAVSKAKTYSFFSHERQLPDVLERRDFESLAQTKSSCRERDPNEWTRTVRCPCSSAVITISR